jgi:hypothetical protein
VCSRLSRYWPYCLVSLLTVILCLCLTRFAPAAADPQALQVQGPATLGQGLGIFYWDAGASSSAPTSRNASSATAASANNVSLSATVGVTNYCSGFSITGGGATAGSNIAVQVTGVVNGPLNYALVVPTGAVISITPLVIQFNPPIAATGANVAITLTVPSFGAGNTAAAVNIHGYRM